MITRHPLSAEDAIATEVMRAASEGRKGQVLGPQARAVFNAGLAAGTPAAPGVAYREAVVGGVTGWWCEPAGARADARLLFLHGGCYVLGSAAAARHFAGQFAARIGASVFVPDYRLAPEHPFPAAVEDAMAVYDALTGVAGKIVVAGESAGGGLTLALLALLANQRHPRPPRGAAVLSPWTDLAFTGASLADRAAADPVFTRSVLEHFAGLYLQGADPREPRASPLYGDLPDAMAPIRIDVGEDEVLLDDSLRYGERLQAAKLEGEAHVWAGMPHVFPAALGRLAAAETCLTEVGAFLGACLQ